MAQFLLLVIAALVVGAIVFGIVVLVTGKDGLGTVEPDGRSVPLPVARPLVENDFGSVRFDVALRGYRMAQVDHALRRAAYDIGYKNELIQVLEAEVIALREGRTGDADVLSEARKTALGNTTPQAPDNQKPRRSDREGDRITEQAVGDSESQAPAPAESPAADPDSEAGAAVTANGQPTPAAPAISQIQPDNLTAQAL